MADLFLRFSFAFLPNRPAHAGFQTDWNDSDEPPLVPQRPVRRASPGAAFSAETSCRSKAARVREHDMTKLQKKAQGRTKQVVGQMIGDDRLVLEGKEEERRADHEDSDELRRRERKQEE